MTEATLCFLLRGNPPSEVLLGLKKAGLGEGKFTGFGGKIESGETVEAAAVREVDEEIGVRLSESDLRRVGRVTFVFPAKPAWDFEVHVFIAEMRDAQPTESAEMKPAWFKIDAIPYAAMWQDAIYWLPLVLAGKHVAAAFTYGSDNETVVDASVEAWHPG